MMLVTHMCAKDKAYVKTELQKTLRVCYTIEYRYLHWSGVYVYEKEEICARQVFSDCKRSQPDDPDHSEKTTDCNFLFNNLKRGSVMKMP